MLQIIRCFDSLNLVSVGLTCDYSAFYIEQFIFLTLI